MGSVENQFLPSVQLHGVSEYKADFAKYLVHHDILRELGQVDWEKLSKKFVLSGQRTTEGIPKKNEEDDSPLKKVENLRVGIVGAGIAGLYTAWICQFLGIDWHIFEANPDRLGGRLYTYWFDEQLAQKPDQHDYYDIGAMRYPYTPVMDRTFRVFEATKTETGAYLMKDEQGRQPTRYNDITYILPKHDPSKPPPPPFDAFKVSKQNGGPVPDDTVRDPDTIMNDAYGRFRDKIKRAIETPRLPEESEEEWRARKEAASARAWKFLLQHDRFSLRDYLTFVEGETFETTHWLETLNAGTGWFDEAFTENVLESLAFEYYDPGEAPKEKQKKEKAVTESSAAPDTLAERGNWYYIKNGSSSLVINVLRKLEKMITGAASDKQFPEAKPEDFPEVMKRISRGKRVVRYGRNVQGEETTSLTLAHVDSNDENSEPVSESFDAIFNSTTFGALQRMDLVGLDLPYDTKAAIRSLRYDPSTKVAIRFKKQWWTDSTLPIVIKGGLGKTDMPLRTCVYPSYNIGEAPAVLLCSYTWGADSERIASMINETRHKDRTQLKKTDQLAQVMLDNLARLHTQNDEEYKKLLAYISSDDVFDTYHAHDWSKDTYTCGGAFALFSPSQFSRVYPAVVRPLADSRFHIIGEAASAHHAWVVGALDSAARAMYLMLGRFKLPEKQQDMIKEFGDIGEVDKNTDYVQIALGMLASKDRACATPAA